MKHDVVCFSCFLHIRNTFHVFVSDTIPWRVTQATCLFLFSHYYHYFSSFFLHEDVQFPNCPRFFLSLSPPFFRPASLFVFFFLLLSCLFSSSGSLFPRGSLLLLLFTFFTLPPTELMFAQIVLVKKSRLFGPCFQQPVVYR